MLLNQISFYNKNELQPASDELRRVVAGLTNAANHLHDQRKEEAIATISAMTEDVTFLHTQTIQGEMLYKREQKDVTETVASIIRQVGEINADMTKVETQISNLNVEIAKKDVDGQELRRQLNNLEQSLANSERERRQHQAQLDNLNDRSAGRIIASIFCFGLDRAIMGIVSLVNQDAAKIKILRDEMSRFNDALSKGNDQLRIATELEATLVREKQNLANSVVLLQQKISTLQTEEKQVRARLAAITQIAGFYGKLKAICENVRENVNWVLDIIEELNDDQPRIIDFDESGQELVPLRTALAKFDSMLNTELVQDALMVSNETLRLA